MKSEPRVVAAIALATACFLTAITAAAADTPTVDEPAIDGYVRSSMAEKRIPGMAVAVVRDDSIVYLKGFGAADPDGRPVTPQTPFLIGSITKTFTATAVMQLVEKGAVDLDGTVVRYLSWFRLEDQGRSDSITIRQLITMTSGIPQWPTSVTWFWPNEPDGIEKHVRFLARIRSAAEPGARFLYSNSGYVVLAAIVERISGLSYAEYVSRNIFKPLSMDHSHTDRAEAERDGLAHGHRWWLGLPVPSAVYVSDSILPAGLLSASAEDMAHFLIAQINGGRYRGSVVLSARATAVMLDRSSPRRYGLGWEFSDVNGRTIVNFDGGNPDSQASVFFDPERNIGVFVAANVMSGLDAFSSHSGASAIDGPTTRAIAETIFSMAAEEPLPDQGIGITRLSIIEAAVLSGFTGLLVWSAIRLRKRLPKIRAARGTGAARRFAAVGILRIALPIAYAVAVTVVPAGRMVLMYQPDAGWWMAAAGAVSATMGILELISCGSRAPRLRTSTRADTSHGHSGGQSLSHRRCTSAARAASATVALRSPGIALPSIEPNGYMSGRKENK